MTLRRTSNFYSMLRTRTFFNVVGILGFVHLFFQVFFRIYVYFNPFSTLYAAIGVFSSSCYFWDDRYFKSHPEEVQRMIGRAEYEFEHNQILYTTNEAYSADSNPSRSLFSFERAMLQPLITSALEHHDLSKITSEVTNIVAEPFNGFGNLYHMIAQSPGGLHKITAFLPASAPRYLPKIEVSRSKHVKVIVPYSKEISRLKTFLQMIRVLMNVDKHFGVVLVDFVDFQSDVEREEKVVKDLIIEELGNVELVNRIVVLPVVGLFSRGLGLNRGAKFVESNCAECTLFFCDIDIAFNQQTLDKCRILAVKETSAYFPVVFSQYNPELSKIHMIKLNILINENSGFWRAFGYGMSCIHSHDFKNSIKFPEYTTWGQEDDIFHSKVKNSGLTVYRVPDPTLIHAYHSKNCSKAADKFACYKTKAIVEGNSKQLGVELFKLREQKTHLTHHKVYF